MKKILYIGNKLGTKGYSPTTIDILGGYLEAEHYTVYYASDKRNKLLRLLHMASSFFKYKSKVDVVLIDTYSTQNFYYAVIIGYLSSIYSIPYIPILHGGNLENRLKSNKKVCLNYFKKAHTLISPSLYLIDVFKKYGYHHLVHIPNTININDYTFNTRVFHEPHLLWVRSFARVYQPTMAIEVYKQIKESYPKATLTMVGPDKDGSLQGAKQLAAQYQLKVNFAGKLSKEAWILLSKKCTIFLNTTTTDNMPVSVIEAMALGLPVVSTNVGGIPYLISHEKTGVLVEKGNVEAMAREIKRLLNNGDWAQKIAYNAREMVALYDWEVVKKSWRNVLDHVS
ncbi:glycosyltransferase family 4 protein [Zhouia sp. PK063]|uniref:glycosyltransferase family 4 protein n=1 Tax=Zhouia sp. PK063 TaxID=3373602 RepID=UPI0037BD0F6A